MKNAVKKSQAGYVHTTALAAIEGLSASEYAERRPWADVVRASYAIAEAFVRKSNEVTSGEFSLGFSIPPSQYSLVFHHAITMLKTRCNCVEYGQSVSDRDADELVVGAMLDAAEFVSLGDELVNKK